MAEPTQESSVTMYDQDGNPVQVPANQATQAYASGRYGVSRGSVRVMTGDGRLGTVPSENLGEFIRRGGSIADPELVAQREYERQHQGALEGARSVAEGFVGAIPFVGSALLEEAGASPEMQRRRRQMDPGLTMLGGAGELLGEFAVMGPLGRAVGLGGEAARGAQALAEGAGATEALTGAARGAEAARGAGIGAEAGAPVAAIEATRATEAMAITPEEALAALDARAAREASAQAALEGAQESAAVVSPRPPTRIGMATEGIEDIIGRPTASQNRVARALRELSTEAEASIEQRIVTAEEAARASMPEGERAFAEAIARPPEAPIGILGEALPAPRPIEPVRLGEAERVIDDIFGPSTRYFEATAASRQKMADATKKMMEHLSEMGVNMASSEAQLVTDALQYGTREQAARAYGLAARAAAQGAFFGAGDYVNEQNLNERPLTIEGILASAATGGVLGGALGLAAQRAAGALQRRFTPLERELADGLAERVNSPSFLERFASSEFVRAMEPTGKLARQLQSGRMQEIGRFGNTFSNGKWTGILGRTSEETLVRAEEAARITGQRVSSMLDKVQGTTNTQPLINKIASVIADLRAEPTGSNRAAARRVQKAIGHFFGQEGQDVSLSELRRMRQLVDREVPRAFELTPAEKTLQIALNDIRATIDTQLREEVARLSPGLAGEFRAANRDYSSAAWIRDAARSAYGRTATDGSAVPISAAVGSSIVFGGLNPAAAFGAIITGLGAQYIKDNAHRLAARAASGASRSAALNRVGTTLRDAIDSSVAHAIYGSAPGMLARKARSMMSDSAYERAAPQLLEIAMTGRPAVSQELVALSRIAPVIASEAQDANARRAMNVANRLPTGGAQDPANALYNIRTASRARIESFKRYAAAAATPDVFLAQVATRSLTREGMDAARENWPSTFQGALEAATAEMMRAKGPLDPQAKRTIGMLLGRSSGLSSPDNLAMLQSSYAAQASAPQVSAPQARALSSGRFSFGRRSMSAADVNQARMMAEGPGK